MPDEVLDLYRAAGRRRRLHRERVGGAARRVARATAPTRRVRSSGRGARRVGRPSCRLRTSGEKVATREASGDCLNAILDVVPGLIGGGADLTGNTGTELKDASVQSAEDARRPPDPLRRPRARHGRRHERHGAPRRRPPGRRHVLRVQRLHARRGAPRRALARPRSSSRGPTTRSASARTARPTSRSSSSRRCGPCPACG